MSAVVLEDFVKPFRKKPLSNLATNWIMRSVVVGMGTICLALVVIVQRMGTVLQLTMSLEAITNGPLLGIFTIGILMPWINATVNHSIDSKRFLISFIFFKNFINLLNQ